MLNLYGIKFVKHPYKSVERNSKTLDLIHTDICDMKSTPSRGGKKYFITLLMTALDFVMYICLIVRIKQLMHLSNTKMMWETN